MYIDKEYVVRVRRELHKVPELGFDLPKSLAIIRAELDALEIPYTEEIGKSCIIATLNEGVGSKTIALRADFDALPIQEEVDVPFASTHPGKMHACGHDCHAAMLLGTAKALKEMSDKLNCCVKFIFQSAEEILGGAKSICDTGFMDGIDSIVACHIHSEEPAGIVSLNRNINSASSRGFTLHLYGKSAHIARPHQGVDAIAIAMRVYNDIQLMRTREINPLEHAVIGIGTIQGGTVANVICDHVQMRFSIRTQNAETDEFIYRRINQIAKSVSEDMGGSAKLEPICFSPVLRNDPFTINAIEAAAIKVVGEENIRQRKDSMGSEDFAYYLQHKPGAMFYIGICTERKPHAPTHNSRLYVNEDALTIGPQVFIQYILDQMENNNGL